jgi:hypothetical protein
MGDGLQNFDLKRKKKGRGVLNLCNMMPKLPTGSKLRCQTPT